MDELLTESAGYLDVSTARVLWGVLLGGFLYCFAGARCIRLCAFLLGVLATCVVAPWFGLGALVTAALALAAGSLALVLWFPVSVALGALAAGVAGASLAIHWGVDWTVLAVPCAVTGLVCGLCIRDVAFVVLTCVLGALGIVGASAELFAMDLDGCWIVVWLVLAVLGGGCQFALEVFLPEKSEDAEAEPSAPADGEAEPAAGAAAVPAEEPAGPAAVSAEAPDAPAEVPSAPVPPPSGAV